MTKNSSQHKRIVLRRIKVAKYFAQGLTQLEIGEKVKVDRSVVSRDLKALEKEWIEAAVDEIAQYKAKEIIKINNMEREAYEAWEKSKREKETKSKKQSGTTEGGRTEVAIKTESNFGDTKYFQVVQWCIDKRCKLLGLDSPKRLEHTGKNGEPIQHEHKSVSDLIEHFQSEENDS